MALVPVVHGARPLLTRQPMADTASGPLPARPRPSSVLVHLPHRPALLARLTLTQHSSHNSSSSSLNSNKPLSSNPQLAPPLV